MSILSVNNLSVRCPELIIVDNVSFTLGEGEWLMLVGPNGAGKSTIINAISQAVDYSGSIMYRGGDLARMKPGERARRIGVLSQNHSVGYSFTVGEVVRLGRYAHSKSFFSGKSDTDEEKVRQALEMTGMTRAIDQSVLTLSGGELQRVFLAQVFAQEPELLILDEPTNHLDLKYQKQIFELIESWLHEGGRAVLSAVHDLSLAKAHGTHALLLDKGRAAAEGAIDVALSKPVLNAVYDMDVYGWMREMLGQWMDKTEV